MRSANRNQLGYLVEEDESDVYFLYRRAIGEQSFGEIRKVYDSHVKENDTELMGTFQPLRQISAKFQTFSLRGRLDAIIADILHPFEDLSRYIIAFDAITSTVTEITIILNTQRSSPICQAWG